MTFTASNGATVEAFSQSIEVSGAGNAEVWLEPWAASSLREYFRAEEDERLGRWRWPENPDCVVYPRAERGSGGRRRVVAINEVSGFHYGVCVEGYTDEPAAVAYFAAHPEPKPWHDAKPWEAWVLTVDGNEWAATLDEDREFRDRAETRGTFWMHITDKRITAATRIYPREEN